MAKSHEADQLPRMPLASLTGFEDFSTGSKIQDTLLRFLIDAMPAWLERNNLQDRLVDAGAVPRNSSAEVGRTHIQKALNALDKKLAQLNEDQGTSWGIQRRRGKGLRLAERRGREIATSTLEGRIKRVEELAAELDPSEDTYGLTQIAYLKRVVAFLVSKLPQPPPEPVRTIIFDDDDEPDEPTGIPSATKRRRKKR
jgi:hypothetical protein